MSPIDRLTPSEREIARMVAAGMLAKEIASIRGTGTAAVKAHLYRIYSKLDLHGGAPRAKLAVLYVEYLRDTEGETWMRSNPIPQS